MNIKTLSNAACGVALLMSMSACVGDPTRTPIVSPDIRARAPLRFHRKTYDEIGSAHIAVLSVTPWEDARNGLQPHFTMTEDIALADSLPDTLALSDKWYSLTQGVFSVNGPKKTVSSEVNTNVDTDGKKSTTTSKSLSSSSGTIPETEINQDTVPQEAKAGVDNIPLTSTGTNTMMRYLAATALYQEVQLINRYIKDGGSIGPGDKAYVVRLQVALYPHQRNLPLDAYTQISFFADNAMSESSASLKDAEAGSSIPQIEVIPLLVTDNLESMLNSRSTESIRQLGGSVAAMSEAAGVGANFNQVNDHLQKALGRDYNSTLTVSKVSPNTVSVRFGAEYSPNGGYSMVPKTNNVTFLVIYRSKATDNEKFVRLTAMARTEFSNAYTGKTPKTRYSIGYDGYKYTDLASQYPCVVYADKKGRFNQESLNNLSWLAIRGNQTEFFRSATALNTCKDMPSNIKTNMYLSLWSDINRSAISNKFSYADFPIDVSPRQFEPPILGQYAIIKNSEVGATVTLSQGQNLDSLPRTILLKMAKPALTLAANLIVVSEDKTSITATFEPLSALKLSDKSAMTIEISYEQDGKAIVQNYPATIVQVTKPAAKVETQSTDVKQDSKAG